MRPSHLVMFYLGKTYDVSGRKHKQMLKWSDEQLEDVHDYIQWLFPLPEASAFNPSAPLLSADDVARFRMNTDLQMRLLASFERLLAFYGFQFADANKLAVERTRSFPEKKKIWLTPGNHNFLRITRILRSLWLLGLEYQAFGFLKALEGLDRADKKVIGRESFRYWKQALE